MKRTSLLVLLAGCGFTDAPGEPIIEAHRGAAGYWPENSRKALSEAIAAEYDAIEFDLVLTGDEIPVLMHDPWIDQEICTTVDGEALTSRILLMDIDYADLSGFRCGGLADPEHPDAEVFEETILRWDELISMLRLSDPDTIVHIDVKYHPRFTLDAATHCDEILTAWWNADLPNPYYLSGGYGELIEACEALAADSGEDLVTSLTYPNFPIDGNNTAVALGNELFLTLGTSDLVAAARRHGADGLNIAWQVADRRRVANARRSGLQVQIWTLNTPELLRAFDKWPVDALITDYPEDAP